MSVQKIVTQKKGSALLIAIVVMAVLTVLSLLLMLVSYTMFSNANKQKLSMQAQEKVQTLSLELEKEITSDYIITDDGTSKKFETYKEELENTSKLWQYLRENVGRSKWPYYNVEVRNHKAENAFRYFKVDQDPDMSICMYWEGDPDITSDFPNNTNLIVVVSCDKGGQKYTVKSTYELTIGDTDNNAIYSDAPKEEEADNKLGRKYKWHWSLSDRE